MTRYDRVMAWLFFALVILYIGIGIALVWPGVFP